MTEEGESSVVQLWQAKAAFLFEAMRKEDFDPKQGLETAIGWAESVYRVEGGLFSSLTDEQKLEIAHNAAEWYGEQGHELPDSYAEYCAIFEGRIAESSEA